MINYILETYATGDVMAETDARILTFLQLSNMTSTEHTEALWSKVLRCDPVYEECVLKGIFIERLHG